jgi:prevent-host-death family protein
MYDSDMTKTVTVSDARGALPRIIERVLAGEEVTLTRHGVPVAVVVRPDSLRSRRAADAFSSAAEVHDLIERARVKPLRTEPAMKPARADDLVSQIRIDRSGS